MQATINGIDALADAARASDQQQTTGDDDDTAALRQELRRRYLSAMRAASPVRSGRFVGGLDIRETPDGFMAEAEAPYSIYVLLGVRAQPMNWVLNRTIAFTARDGTPVVRKVTRVGEGHWYHPGTPPRDVFRIAWEDAGVQQIIAALAEAGVTARIAYLYPVSGT